MLRRPLLISSLLAVTYVVAACDLGGPTRACTDELRIRLTPADTAILVGQSFTADISLSTCGGSVSLDDDFTFQSNASDVADVDQATGLVTGKSIGVAAIYVSGTKYGPLAAIDVAVAAPGGA